MLVGPLLGFQKRTASFEDSVKRRHVTNMHPRSVYIHVPFCAHRCGYCDFTLVAGKDHLAETYLEALEREMSSVSGHPEVDTVFLGGGTPTHLQPSELSQLMRLIHDRFQITSDCEFSIEANPFGLTDEKLDVLQAAGINRISLGLQSFDANILATLERDHRHDDIMDCVARIQRRFSNVAFDLIFAVPGLTLDLWRQTLQTAIDLQPNHISTYGLTFEKGTAFWTRRMKGQLQQADDELERAMYALAMDELSAVGFEQYEISNFAKPGCRSRHNQVYWTGLPYWGFGPGAASYLDHCRRLNHRSVTTWIQRVLNGEPALYETELLSLEDRAREALVLGLRRNEGVDRSEFADRTGFTIEELTQTELARMLRRGLIWDEAGRIGLTREGRFVADYVVGQML